VYRATVTCFYPWKPSVRLATLPGVFIESLFCRFLLFPFDVVLGRHCAIFSQGKVDRPRRFMQRSANGRARRIFPHRRLLSRFKFYISKRNVFLLLVWPTSRSTARLLSSHVFLSFIRAASPAFGFTWRLFFWLCALGPLSDMIGVSRIFFDVRPSFFHCCFSPIILSFSMACPHIAAPHQFALSWIRFNRSRGSVDSYQSLEGFSTSLSGSTTGLNPLCSKMYEFAFDALRAMCSRSSFPRLKFFQRRCSGTSAPRSLVGLLLFVPMYAAPPCLPLNRRPPA